MEELLRLILIFVVFIFGVKFSKWLDRHYDRMLRERQRDRKQYVFIYPVDGGKITSYQSRVDGEAGTGLLVVDSLLNNELMYTVDGFVFRIVKVVQVDFKEREIIYEIDILAKGED